MGRRQNRYIRRNQKREEKRKQNLKDFLKFENVISFKSLYKAANDSAKGVRWKESVQRYMLNIFVNISKLRRDLLKGKDIRMGFIEFDLNERGKVRHIRSVHFRERVVQKSICTNTLSPVLTYNLITDNGASQKYKGTLFATNRLTQQLRKYYNKHGNNGFVLLIDFKSYFDNIEHEPLKQMIRKYISDENILRLSDDFINAFGAKGLGLGSETSQINAIAYINKIDHFIKDIEQNKYYGRYMDDSYVIHYSKEYLQNLLERLTELYAELGVIVNKKKTYITDLKHGFTFLKTRFFLTNSGKIIRKPCQDSITRERRKLKRQFNLLHEGLLTLKDINTSFQSWKGSMLRRNARRTVFEMQKLYNNLFKKEKELNR